MSCMSGWNMKVGCLCRRRCSDNQCSSNDARFWLRACGMERIPWEYVHVPVLKAAQADMTCSECTAHAYLMPKSSNSNNSSIPGSFLTRAVCACGCRDLRRAGHLGEFVHVHLQNDACHISSDGGRVCRPLIICDKGVPRVKQEHIDKLKTGEWGFPDFLKAGK